MGSDNLYWIKKRGRPQRQSKKNKEYIDSILIVCEGGQTEPNYFNSFPVTNVKIKTIGAGKNTLSLIDHAIKKWKEFARDGAYYEKVWCVFDRDDFPLNNYNEAFAIISHEEKKINQQYKKKVGRKVKIKIAYSNEAFELWYLLHYDYFQNGMKRSQYKNMLNKRLGKEYKKNDPKMYSILDQLAVETKGLQGQFFAINNAKKLRKHSTKKDKHNYNPSTNVDKLVEDLNKHLKK